MSDRDKTKDKIILEKKLSERFFNLMKKNIEYLDGAYCDNKEGASSLAIGLAYACVDAFKTENDYLNCTRSASASIQCANITRIKDIDVAIINKKPALEVIPVVLPTRETAIEAIKELRRGE